MKLYFNAQIHTQIGEHHNQGAFLCFLTNSNNNTKKEIAAFLFVPLLAEYVYKDTNKESWTVLTANMQACIFEKKIVWQMKRQAANNKMPETML